MKRYSILAILLIVINTSYSQVFYIILPIGLAKGIVPEHGFLPGKQFKIYPTLQKYDFDSLKLRAELYDQRDSLKLTKIECSEVEINNQSEFNGPSGAVAVSNYFQALSSQSNIVLDSAATDTLKMDLEALDSRLIGFGKITAHGLCKMTFRLGSFVKSYCIDITDKSPHSPIGKNAFVTRKTATRVIQSASIREVIESFFADMKAVQRK